MNIYDIAKEAGVSISTVSRVINNKSRVSPETVEKIRRVMQKCNYTPNPVARGLVNKTLRTIGIVTVDIRGLHYASLAYNVLQKLNDFGYNCLFCNAGYEEAEQEKNIRTMASNCIDGAVFIGSTLQTPFVQKIVTEYMGTLPIVMVNASFDLPNVYSVCCDDKKGVADAVRLLIGHGNREICYVGCKKATISGAQKMSGYEEQIRAAGLKLHVLKEENSIEGGAEAVKNALKNKTAFTAYVFEHDMQAVGGVNVLKASGVRIPEEVEVITYNQSVLSLAVTPHLSCVDNKLYQIGVKAAELLNDVIEGNEPANKIVYSPTLLLRDSTRKA